MRLRVRLPEVRPDEYAVPLSCPYGCGGRYFALHDQCHRPLSDPTYKEVQVRRYKCVSCRRSFRVHPTGVSQHHRSQRLRGIGVLLYVLGLSYGGVADALAAFGWPGSRSTIYRDVQDAGEAVMRLRRQQPQRKVQVVSADATYVVCRGEEVTVAVALDALAGEVLEVELVEGESADALRAFLQRLQTEYGMEVLVSDDQDSYKVVADELGIEHSICRAHVNRNVARITGELAQQALHADTSPPPGVTRSRDELLADLEYSQLLIALRPADGAAQLSQLLRHYQAAPPPAKGEKASLWYRFRLSLLRWSNNWPRLTFDQRWNRQHETHLDGTNNGAGSKNAIAPCVPTNASLQSPILRTSFLILPNSPTSHFWRISSLPKQQSSLIHSRVVPLALFPPPSLQRSLGDSLIGHPYLVGYNKQRQVYFDWLRTRHALSHVDCRP